MEAIHDYFTGSPEMSSQHKFRLFQVLEKVIAASTCLEEPWRRSFMQLALENMTKSTELEYAYQDSASNVLVAICRHSWREVARHLETELLNGVFPHRSFLYVMGVLSSQAEELLNKEDKAHWEDLLAQIVLKSVQFLNVDTWYKQLMGALTKLSQTQQEQPPEKAFLFTYYGLILQAEEDGTKARAHLQALLQTSHQWPKQREGMALTVGLAAARHLDHIWAVLDQFGRSPPIKWTLQSPTSKVSEDLQWKWASSTILLAYGQVAANAKAHILPWVDNILSRMIFHFRYSFWDETLKQSFLDAISMLLGAISRNEGAHSYEFSQTSQLLDCLMVLMEKEPPGTLYTASRQRILHIVSGVCELRPPIDEKRKARLLSTCYRSVFTLPVPSALEKHTCLFLEPPNIQTLYSQTVEALDLMLQSLIKQNPTAAELHLLLSDLYTWLASEKAHERQRAAHSCTNLLGFLNQQRCLGPKEDSWRMGQLAGALGILCQDPDEDAQHSGLKGLDQLYQLLTCHHRKGAPEAESQAPKKLPQPAVDGASLWGSGDQAAHPAPQEVASPKDGIFQQDIWKATQVKTLAGWAVHPHRYLYQHHHHPIAPLARAHSHVHHLYHHHHQYKHRRSEERGVVPTLCWAACPLPALGWVGTDIQKPSTASTVPTQGDLEEWIPRVVGSLGTAEAVTSQLTAAELIDLMLTAAERLAASSPFLVQAAAKLLLIVAQEHGAKLETVASIGRAIHSCLSSVRIPQAKDNALRAISLLARNHTPELVATFLDFSTPVDRCPLCQESFDSILQELPTPTVLPSANQLPLLPLLPGVPASLQRQAKEATTRPPPHTGRPGLTDTVFVKVTQDLLLPGLLVGLRAHLMVTCQQSWPGHPPPPPGAHSPAGSRLHGGSGALSSAATLSPGLSLQGRKVVTHEVKGLQILLLLRALSVLPRASAQHNSSPLCAHLGLQSSEAGNRPVMAMKYGAALLSPRSAGPPRATPPEQAGRPEDWLHTFSLWKAMGSEPLVSDRVLAMLLAWLQKRPLPTPASDSNSQTQEKTYLHSLAAMSVLHELQFTPEFKKAVWKAYPQLLLGLLTQGLYVLELGLPTEPPRGQQAPPSLRRILDTNVIFPCYGWGSRGWERVVELAWAARRSSGTEAWLCALSWIVGLPAYSSHNQGGQTDPPSLSIEPSLGPSNTCDLYLYSQSPACALRTGGPQVTDAAISRAHSYPKPAVVSSQLGLPPLVKDFPAFPVTTAVTVDLTPLQALKDLLSTTGHWHDFAPLELQGAWGHFTSICTYLHGVGLLARAMVQNHCWKVKAVLSQLLLDSQRPEERERRVAFRILTEFLYSPIFLEVLPRQAARTMLARGLHDTSPEVRVYSLQGLGNIIFHPEKESLLRGQLSHFLGGFFQNSEPVVVGIMGTVSDVLHCLGTLGVGAQGLSIAINARSFFDDERDQIRAAAMALFGDLVTVMAGRKLDGLRTQVHQSMVPLLLHLKDECPAVAVQAKSAFYHCARLLCWQLPHTLFCSLAWERRLSARHFLWSCLMTGSQEEFSIHLAQALSYLHSRRRHTKIWAALFLGYTICYHAQAVSQMVSDRDTHLLLCTFEDLQKDSEPSLQEFATRQLSFFRKVTARPQQ
ncbi:maestro heat-like repeat family member 5 [Ctenodactylus gundi]